MRFGVRVRFVQSRISWVRALRFAPRFASLVDVLRIASHLALALIFAGASACSDAEQRGTTQVTARIYIEGVVRAQMSELRVRSYRGTRGQFILRTDRAYPLAELQEVVDVSFARKAGEEEGSVLVVADALSQAGQVLVEARATFAFVLGEERLFELWLYRCGDMPLGELCAEPECADAMCLTCVRDRCAATPLYSKPQLVVFDPAIAADPEKPPPGRTTQGMEEEPSGLDAGARDAGFDAASSARDGGCAESCDAAQVEDAGSLDPSSDAAADTSTDEPDTGTPDAGSATPEDAAVDAQEPPGRCAQDSAWTLSGTNAVIPPLARTLAQHTNATGALDQYLCRMRTPDGIVLTPGKVSGSVTNPGRFDFGCYSTFYGPAPGRPGQQAWQSFGIDTAGGEFQVLTPSSDCQLDWVPMSAGQALPARALAVGNTGGATPQPLYACRVNITDALTSGTHIGRLGSAPGDLCHVQYYRQTPPERSQFEVLVQTRP